MSDIRRILLFGDDLGLPQLVRWAPRALILGLVGAGIRAKQHVALSGLARREGLELLIQPQRRSRVYRPFVERIADMKPDLIIVNSYSMYLPADVLAIPSHGAINVHTGLLPQYRGPNPIQWAILNRESETGVTLHYMNEEIDCGDVIAQRTVPILFEDTWRDVQARLMESTESILREEIPKILSQTNARIQQDESRARRFRRRQEADGCIEWSWPVRSIHDLVRSLVLPHPGAFYVSGEKRMVLDRYLTVSEITALKFGAEGGQVLRSAGFALEPVEETSPSNQVVSFQVRAIPGNRLVGKCRLTGIDHVGRVAEIQIEAGQEEGHSPNFETEVMRLLIQFSFDQLDLCRVLVHSAVGHPTIERLKVIGFREGSAQANEERKGPHAHAITLSFDRTEHARTEAGRHSPA